MTNLADQTAAAQGSSYWDDLFRSPARAAATAAAIAQAEAEVAAIAEWERQQQAAQEPEPEPTRQAPVEAEGDPDCFWAFPVKDTRPAGRRPPILPPKWIFVVLLLVGCPLCNLLRNALVLEHVIYWFRPTKSGGRRSRVRIRHRDGRRLPGVSRTYAQMAEDITTYSGIEISPKQVRGALADLHLAGVIWIKGRDPKTGQQTGNGGCWARKQAVTMRLHAVRLQELARRAGVE